MVFTNKIDKISLSVSLLVIPRHAFFLGIPRSLSKCGSFFRNSSFPLDFSGLILLFSDLYYNNRSLCSFLPIFIHTHIAYSRNRIVSAPSTFHSPSRKLPSILPIGRNRFQIVSKARLPTSFIAAALVSGNTGAELHFPQSVPE